MMIMMHEENRKPLLDAHKTEYSKRKFQMNAKYSARSDVKQELSADFQPGQYDVVCGKG